MPGEKCMFLATDKTQMKHRFGWRNFKFSISNLTFNISDFGFRISDFKEERGKNEENSKGWKNAGFLATDETQIFNRDGIFATEARRAQKQLRRRSQSAATTLSSLRSLRFFDPRYSLRSPRSARNGWVEIDSRTPGSPRGLGQPGAEFCDTVGFVSMECYAGNRIPGGDVNWGSMFDVGSEIWNPKC